MGSCQGQSMWDLWWTKWQWDRLFSKFFGFPVNIIPPCLSMLLYTTTWGINNRPVVALVQIQCLTSSTWTTTTAGGKPLIRTIREKGRDKKGKQPFSELPDRINRKCMSCSQRDLEGEGLLWWTITDVANTEIMLKYVKLCLNSNQVFELSSCYIYCL
jgi:hypothetical protein